MFFYQANKRRKIFSSLLLAAFLLSLPVFISAQKINSGESMWYWRSKPDKNGGSFQLAVFLEVKGKKVSGTLEARGLDNGEWNGGDGAMTPFVGRIVGETIEIEYNDADWRNGESDDIFKPYKKPGRQKRFTARLRLRGAALEFLQLYGRHETGYPTKMMMVAAEDLDKTGK
jgi:hypothetical protein